MSTGFSPLSDHSKRRSSVSVLFELVNQVHQALQIRRGHARALIDIGIGDEIGIEAEFDAQMIADFVVELRPETGERHGRWREPPFRIELPQIPRCADLAHGIVLHEFARGAHDVFDRFGGIFGVRKLTFELRRLQPFDHVGAQFRAASG